MKNIGHMTFKELNVEIMGLFALSNEGKLESFWLARLIALQKELKSRIEKGNFDDKI